jgi:hypothetical protein
LSFTAEFTPEILEQVLKRSEEGCGVKQAFEELNLDGNKGIEWLQKYHHGRVVAAKKIQIQRKEAADKAKAKEAEAA